MPTNSSAPLLSPATLAVLVALSRVSVQEQARGRADIVEGLRALMQQIADEGAV